MDHIKEGIGHLQLAASRADGDRENHEYAQSNALVAIGHFMAAFLEMAQADMAPKKPMCGNLACPESPAIHYH